MQLKLLLLECFLFRVEAMKLFLDRDETMALLVLLQLLDWTVEIEDKSMG